MRVLLRFSIWVALPAVALAVVLAWSAAAPRHDDGDLGAQMRARDAKLQRTVLFHEMTGTDGPLPPLAEVNREGLAIELRIDPETWALMHVERNRRHYKRRPVNVAVRFGDRPFRAATVRLRGKGTLRMSFELNLGVKLFRAVKLAPGVSLKRFHLMAMIEDPFEVKTVFGYRVFRSLGLFAPWFQYVRLVVNGEAKGMFLLLEPASRSLRRTRPGTVAICRRERENLFRTEWTASVPDVRYSLATLRDLNVQARVENPVEAYGRVLDLDQYFTWLGVHVMLRNPDHLDELFLYEVRANRAVSAPLKVMAWDPDAMLGAFPKKGAVSDPLLFSALGTIDSRIKEAPALYARYRAVLRGLLEERLTIERLEEILDSVAALRDGLDDGRPAEEQETRRKERRTMVERMKSLIRLRHARLRGHLEEPPQ